MQSVQGSIFAIIIKSSEVYVFFIAFVFENTSTIALRSMRICANLLW